MSDQAEAGWQKNETEGIRVQRVPTQISASVIFLQWLYYPIKVTQMERGGVW